MSKRGWEEYEEEIARRFAASYLSVHTGSAYSTMYRKLKDKKIGQLWILLARMAIEKAGSPGDAVVDLEELDFEGPVQ